MKNHRLKVAMAISAVLMILWGVLGAGATLAWFGETTEVVTNRFNIGELDLKVSYRLDDGRYVPVLEDTKLFDDEALYEPGYTQVIYLKIENVGNVEFDYRLSTDVIDVVPGRNVYGGDIYLPRFLKYAVVLTDEEQLLTRPQAQAAASGELFNHYVTGDRLYPVGGSGKSVQYAALIVHMPEYVGNEANYRGDAVPQVEFGITVLASQADAGE